VDEDGFDYRGMVLDASIGVVRQVLAHVAAEGMRADHHFFLTFATRYPGVELPPSLRLQFPESMTIVLQNQFWDLEAEALDFAVTLRFGGALERLRVPYRALTTFIDPSVPFGLDLTPFGGGRPDGSPPPAREEDEGTEGGTDLESGQDNGPEPPAAPSGGGAVVPFRRR
jgi:hypothetical protein